MHLQVIQIEGGTEHSQACAGTPGAVSGLLSRRTILHHVEQLPCMKALLSGGPLVVTSGWLRFCCGTVQALVLTSGPQ